MVIHDAGLQFRFPAGKRSITSDIILHHAAGGGSVEAIHRYHRDTNGWDGIGYHYYVRKDGSVWRGRPEDTIGAHTVGHNYSSIGVCFEGNFEVDIMPAAQLAAGRELIADILSRYPGAEVSGHRDNDSTACPGKNFPGGFLFSSRKPVYCRVSAEPGKLPLCIPPGGSLHQCSGFL